MDAKQATEAAKGCTDVDFGGDWLARKVLKFLRPPELNGDSDA